MMYISKIVLKNFKSFGKRTEVPFVSGFTVISGPNGSGKSNVIDAILFCLGLSTSTKQLRADRLTDLIHNGKTNAEVSIYFKNENETYEVSRKIKVTEKGYYSYYYLNGNSVSLSDIHRFLSQFGVFSDAYNIVMQGDVTRIIEMSPFQRRKIIDDIAGISEFDEKKERAFEELERVRENIEKLDAVIAEVNDRLNSLERDRDEALRYKSLLEEKEKMGNALKAHRYLSLKSSVDKLRREIDKLEREKDQVARKIPEIVNKITYVSSRVEEVAARISKMGDEKISELQSRILELTSEMESIRSSEKFYLEEIKKIESDVIGRLNELSRLREEVEVCTKELEGNLLRRVNISEIAEELESKIEQLKVRLQEVDKKHRDQRDRLVSRRDELERLKEERGSLLRERDTLIEILRRANMEIDDLERRTQNLKSELDGVVEEMEKTEEILVDLQSRIKKLVDERNDVDRRLFSIRSELADVEEEIKGKEVELAKIKAKLSTLQTYSKPVELILNARNKRELPGVFGTVAQLGEVEEKYITALEAAAGKSLQYIVVETEDDAVECIKYLKTVRGGRATFLPLRRIQNFNFKLRNSLLEESGVIDYAVRLVKCEKKFLPVFRFILRDTLVVDRIETARRLMDRGVRLVTLDGDVVEKSGLMSGGSAEKGRGILLSRELLEKEKSLSEQIVELQKRKESLLAELNERESSRRELQNSIEKLNSQLVDLEGRIKLLEGREGDIENRIFENEEMIEKRRGEIEENSAKLREISSEIQRKDEKISKIQREIEEIEKKLRKSEIPKITEELDRLREEYGRNRETLLSIDKKIETLEFKRKQLQKSIDEKRREVEELNSRKAELQEKIEYGRVRVEEIRQELKELKEKEDRIGEEVRSLRDERDRYLRELRELESEKRKLEFEMEKLDEKIGLQVENLTSMEDELRGYGEVCVPKDLPPLSYVRKKLQKLQEEIGKFGDVNLKAIHEYESVRQRRDELAEKKLVLEKERSDIIEKIERYEKRKREAFYETFNSINRNFAEVIRELTDGEGELYLESDDPFSSGLYIRIKPYNKPVQKLESMSGGEKSLVALALIFAIQKFKPASFYAFDEIDMFLDGVNVGRVANVIRERSKEAQFIVVSLRKPMIEKADAVVGVTMGRDNSSLVTGIKLKA